MYDVDDENITGSSRSQVFLIVQDLQMISTHVKFEARIPYDSNFVAFTRNYIKFLSFKGNLTLKVKITSFQTHLRYLDDQ